MRNWAYSNLIRPYFHVISMHIYTSTKPPRPPGLIFWNGCTDFPWQQSTHRSHLKIQKPRGQTVQQWPQSINQSINQPNNQSIKQSIDQSINQTINQARDRMIWRWWQRYEKCRRQETKLSQHWSSIDKRKVDAQISRECTNRLIDNSFLDLEKSCKRRARSWGQITDPWRGMVCFLQRNTMLKRHSGNNAINFNMFSDHRSSMFSKEDLSCL